MPPASARSVRVFAPASLSNLGPGFDVMGVALACETRALGDVVEAWRIGDTGVTLDKIRGLNADQIPSAAGQNAAALAADALLNAAGRPFGVRLALEKGIPLGSGIGGSAASAVAGAFAANALLDAPLPTSAVLRAALVAEAHTSGGTHADNVLPCLLGGAVLANPDDPSDYLRLQGSGPGHLVLMLPDLRVLTHQARALLPTTVSLGETIRQCAALARLIAAWQTGDAAEVGRWIEADRMVEPRRVTLVPVYHAVKTAARTAGATGVALSGSGPAMFAVAPSADAAKDIAAAMVQACEEAGVAAWAAPVTTSAEGVRYCK